LSGDTSIPSLPLIIAGPILRLTEPGRVCVWIATKWRVQVTGYVYDAAAYRTQKSRTPELGTGETVSICLGKQLFISLVVIVPTPSPKGNKPVPFRLGTLLAYDLVLTQISKQQSAAKMRVVEGAQHMMDLIPGKNEITYGDFPLPTFFIAEDANLNILHGSCRKLHGEGGDALALADSIIGGSWNKLPVRPSALFLTGDQIYADDVAEPIIQHILKLGAKLLGWYEMIPLPNGGSIGLDQLRCGARGRLVSNRHTDDLKPMFSSDAARNHLIGFGDFAAMYLLEWSRVVWPTESISTQPDCYDLHSPNSKEINQQASALESTRQTLPAVRRALANIPTYMIMDDHEITDDWNLTENWQKNVLGSGLGRRILANGLAAYWAFQGWGNDPGNFPPEFVQTIVDSLTDGSRGSGDAFDQIVINFEKKFATSWSFVAPTNPPTIFLNTRTQRGFDTPTGPPRLLGKAALDDFVLKATEALGKSKTLLLVAPTPVFGIALIEYLQELLSRENPAPQDLESWHANLGGFYEFLRRLSDLNPSTCVILSGDLHYAYAMKSSFTIGPNGPTTVFVQFTSSALKNSPGSVKGTLVRLAATKRRHLKIWLNPVTAVRRPVTGYYTPLIGDSAWEDFLRRPPIVLDYPTSLNLNIETPPDYLQDMMELGPDGDSNAKLLNADSNLGQLIIDGGSATMSFWTPKGRSSEKLTISSVNLTSAL
jgi:hypothetical protein